MSIEQRMRHIAGQVPRETCPQCGSLIGAALEAKRAEIGRGALDLVKKHYGIEDDGAALAVLRGKDAGLAALAEKALDAP